MNFKDKLSFWANFTNERLKQYMKVERFVPQKSIYEAMNYSLMAGGKRLRPILVFSVCEILSGDIEKVIPIACALEMIHTYSLIHDDLPAMDNDDYRRGKPTNHKVFGEAAAILTGDALLNNAFEIMIKDALLDQKYMKRKLKAALIIAEASGDKGMIAGQVIDMESEGKKIDIETLKYMHRCKTGALIRASMMAPAEVLGALPEQKKALENYAKYIGLSFQIKDDILDVESTLEELGKPVGSDKNNNKSTYVTLMGLARAKDMLKEVTEDAVRSLNIFGEKAVFLKELAYYIANRSH